MQDFDADGLHRIEPPRFHGMPGSNAHLLEAQRPRTHAMRRRVLVFFGVFLVCAAASLAYTFMRPAIYMADARVQVTPSDLRPSGAASAPRDMSQAFLIELQILSSRPLLEKVARKLAGANTAVNVEEQVLSLQEMLSVKPIEGTNVVLLEARSPDRLAVARLVNTVIDVYRETQAVTGKTAEETQLADARETARLMDEKVAAKRRAAEEFRIRNNIVSSERDENETLSRLKGLGTSLAAAAEREAKAEGRVRALEQAANDSKRTVQSKDNPTVAGMEVRLSQMREEWRAMERQFTPQYLDMDQNARGLKQRIANLEQQIDAERQKSQQNALAEARDELASVKTSSQRMQQQLTDDRQNVQGFTRRFAEFKVMQDELKGLDEMRQAARQRLITLESTATERKPRMMVVEPAAIPESAWRPLYARDAGIAVVASLLLGFLAVWFVEFFNRTEPVLAGPSTVIIPQPWMQQGHHSHGPGLGNAPAAQALAHHASGAAEVGLLARPLPRELTQREVQMLLAAASPEHLLVLVCLLCGIGPEEIAALRVEHLHADADGAHSLHIPGESPRVLPLVGPLAGLSAAADPGAQALPLIPAPNGQPLKTDDIAAAVTSSAFDSGLDQPQSITPESLRHTYVAFLVRQGLKFGDMGRIVGKLSPEMLNALAPLAPHGERRPIGDIVRMMPAVLDLFDAV